MRVYHAEYDNLQVKLMIQPFYGIDTVADIKHNDERGSRLADVNAFTVVSRLHSRQIGIRKEGDPLKAIPLALYNFPTAP